MTTLLKPEQIARRLNVSQRAVYDMLAPGGQLHHLRICLGRKTLRVDEIELNNYIESRKGAFDAT